VSSVVASSQDDFTTTFQVTDKRISKEKPILGDPLEITAKKATLNNLSVRGLRITVKFCYWQACKLIRAKKDGPLQVFAR